jgi:hypothetical protein
MAQVNRVSVSVSTNCRVGRALNPSDGRIAKRFNLSTEPGDAGFVRGRGRRADLEFRDLALTPHQLFDVGNRGDDRVGFDRVGRLENSGHLKRRALDFDSFSGLFIEAVSERLPEQDHSTITGGQDSTSHDVEVLRGQAGRINAVHRNADQGTRAERDHLGETTFRVGDVRQLAEPANGCGA